MRIMIDTNVILSGIYKRGSLPDRVIQHVCEHQELVLCDHIIAECYDVVARRFPAHTPALDALFANLRYELVAAPRATVMQIADSKDQPILNAAIANEIDVLVSGDKHFLKLDIEHPRVLAPAQYLEWVGMHP